MKVGGEPTKQIVNNKQDARGKVKDEEHRVMTLEGEREDTHHNGCQHQPVIKTEELAFALLLGLYKMINKLSYLHLSIEFVGKGTLLF